MSACGGPLQFADLFNAPDDEDSDLMAGQVVVKMRSLASRLEEETRENFEHHTGQPPEIAIQDLPTRSGAEMSEWLKAHPRAVELLEQPTVGNVKSADGVVISRHEDELLRIEEIFARTPSRKTTSKASSGMCGTI